MHVRNSARWCRAALAASLLLQAACGSPEPGSPPAASGGLAGSAGSGAVVPLPPGRLSDAGRVRVARDGEELAAARGGLATYADGSLRSVQIQVDLDVLGSFNWQCRSAVQGPAFLE